MLAYIHLPVGSVGVHYSIRGRRIIGSVGFSLMVRRACQYRFCRGCIIGIVAIAVMVCERFMIGYVSVAL